MLDNREIHECAKQRTKLKPRKYTREQGQTLCGIKSKGKKTGFEMRFETK